MNLLMLVPLLVLILVAFALGAIPAFLAKRKHRSFPLWWVAGAFGFPIALVAILCFGDLEQIPEDQRAKSRLKERIILTVILVLWAAMVAWRVHSALSHLRGEIQKVHYSMSILPDRLIWNGQAMTEADVSQAIRKDVRERGMTAFAGGTLSVNADPSVLYGRVTSCLTPAHVFWDYRFSVASGQPIQIYSVGGLEAAIKEELITVDEGRIRTKDGIIPFQGLEKYLSKSKATNDLFRVIVNATPNTAVMDFYNALVVSKRYAADCLRWDVWGGLIEPSNSDWNRLRPKGLILKEYDQEAESVAAGEPSKPPPQPER